MPTPAVIAITVIVGGLTLFPVVSLLLNSKKILAFSRTSWLGKLTDRFQKPRVLESDEFLHERNFEKLTQVAQQAENSHSEKFGNTEFMTFVKIKSYINRSINEYAGLDDSIEMLTVAIAAQHSFAVIDGSESRHCSSTQQELYKLVNSLLTQQLSPSEFKQQVNQKLAELLPILRTEEGKVALRVYAIEVLKIAEHPLGLKLLLLFKRYQFDDFSTLRSVSDTINKLENEDLLNPNSLLLLVMAKYDLFEKLGPIIGVIDPYNRPETYAKMLQYMGLKIKYEVSYTKFCEFLLLIEKWKIHYQTVINVRQKYKSDEYRLPKKFTTTIPAEELYQKYKDNLQSIGQKKSNQLTSTNSNHNYVVWDKEADVLVGTK